MNYVHEIYELTAKQLFETINMNYCALNCALKCVFNFDVVQGDLGEDYDGLVH